MDDDEGEEEYDSDYDTTLTKTLCLLNIFMHYAKLFNMTSLLDLENSYLHKLMN